MNRESNQVLQAGRSIRTLALLRFHLGAGVRLVQRVFLPLFGSFVIIYAFFGPDFFQAFMGAIVGGGFLFSAVPVTIFVLIMAQTAGRRVLNGMVGWIQHLPVAEKSRKFQAAVALLVSILPVLAIISLLALMAAVKYRFEVTPFLVGLPLAGMAAAFFVLPVKRRYLSRLILLLSCFCLVSQDWMFMLAGLVLGFAGAWISGPLRPGKKIPGFSTGRLFHAVLNWRALRLRVLIPYLLSFLNYPVLFLFISNNSNSEFQTAMLIRLFTGGSLVLFCATFMEIMVRRKPYWPWIRSMPWSARQRITKDASFLLIHLLPLVFVALVIRPQLAPFIFISLPGLAIFSVMCGFRIQGGRFGVFGLILGQTLLPVFLFGLTAWISLAVLFLTPWLLKKSAMADMSFPVREWQEVFHVADSDNFSWRGI